MASASDRTAPGRLAVLAQGQATPAPTWTPPPIPQPLPTPGGPIATPVGAAPPQADAAPVGVANPEASGSPGAIVASPATTGGENPVVAPGAPAQPAATPAPVATPDPEVPPAAEVAITPDFRFDPAEVTVRVGESVAWTNTGRSPQTVTADPARADDPSLVVLPQGAQPFSSGVVNAGATFAHTFDVAGEYAYLSMPQEARGMVGRVIVEG